MSFRFRWRHNDGSIVEFSEKGWRTDDPEKDAWLNKMSVRNSPSPVFTLGIKIWLQKNCQLVESGGVDEADNLNNFPGKRGNEFDRSEATGGNASHSVSRPSEEKSEVVRPAGRKAMISRRSIELACDEFFRSRGMLPKDFNQWRRHHRTDESENQPNTKSVQNARVEECQRKISRASQTSDRRKQARLNR
jgi:hypothetical protein